MCSRSDRQKRRKKKRITVLIKLCTQPGIPKPTTELASFQDRRGLPKRRLGFRPQQNCRSHYAVIICCRQMTLSELSALHKKQNEDKQRWLSSGSHGKGVSGTAWDLMFVTNTYSNTKQKNDRLLTLRQCCIRSFKTGTKTRSSSFPILVRVPATRACYFSKIKTCRYHNVTLRTLMKYCARYIRR